MHSLTIQSRYIPTFQIGKGAQGTETTFDDCWIGVLDVGEIDDA